MKTTIKVRNHTHVFEPAGDIAYRINTQREEYRKKFKRWWIDEMALSMALVISGADPLAVTAPSSPFKRAAIDMWDFMTGIDSKYGYICDFYSFAPRPMYGDNYVAITYYKKSNHQPVMITYFNDGNVDVCDMQLRNDIVKQMKNEKL